MTSSPTKSSRKPRKSSEKSEPKPTGLKELEPTEFNPPVRGTDGRFLPGTSGNPAGRPLTVKNQLTNVKQALELAVRENISPHQIAQIVHRMYEMALMGSVGAAKLLLDKTISNAKSEEEEDTGGGGVTIKIENFTLPAGGETIDVTPTKEES